MKIALLISTYNWPEAIDLCLKSVMQQVVLPDEIIIADDGSKEPTLRVIQQYQQLSKVPIIHVWHEDNGFQVGKIRNKAIAQSTSDYIVQIDGDMLLHPYFISDHKAFAKPNSFVRASRIYLNDSLTAEKFQTKDVQINRFDKRVSNFFSAFRSPLLWGLLASNYKMKGAERWEIHGCNMAFWRSNMIGVNGYNEEMVGWGLEDKEVVVRLLNAGFEKRFLKFGGIAFHLHHPYNSRNNYNINEVIFQEAIQKNSKYCSLGIAQYLIKE